VPSRSIHRLLLPEPGHAGIFKGPNFARRMLADLGRLLFVKPIELKAGDMLVMLDGCAKDNPLDLLEKAHDQGATLGAISYDLIPLQYPQMFHPNLVSQFRSFMAWAVKNVDFFVAISETVKHDVQDFVQEHAPERVFPEQAFSSFPLGAELDYPTGSARIRQDIVDFFAEPDSAAPFLTVGTIEPRKNHRFVIEALDRVWEENDKARLCIIGRTGWLCHEIISAIRNHPRFSSHILLITDASDHELEYCYQHSAALIFPSKAEGFGLPIVEALQHGLPVLASGIPIHREVGGQWCAYFEPGVSDDLADLMLTVLEGNAKSLTLPAETYPPRTWVECCRRLLAGCMKQHQAGYFYDGEEEEQKKQPAKTKLAEYAASRRAA
jgi:alpha-1,2-rhamnosyltransferase